jgi:hypothetical protein
MCAPSVNVHGRCRRLPGNSIRSLRYLGRVHEQTVRVYTFPPASLTTTNTQSYRLGLRSAVAKTSLLLCDLYFIVFSASNLSLAFDALFDRRWACYEDAFKPVGDAQVRIPATCPDNPSICYKQKALGGVLFISLVAWLTTFSISVMRVVEKLR